MIANALFRIILGLIIIGVPLFLLNRALDRVLKREKSYSKAPFPNMMLRPPGESLRIKIYDIEGKILETGLSVIVPIALAGVTVMQIPASSLSSWLVLLITIPALCYAFITRQWIKMKKLREDLRSYRLGFDGERYIANELSPLIASGYRIFHDFQVDFLPGGEETNFNIDHVAIGPSGIFAIETKAKRKLIGKDPSSTQENHKVFIDGSTLKFPNWDEHKWIPQAERGADELRKWLTGSDGRRSRVVPVLVIPGWWVEQKGKTCPIEVFSGNNLARAFSKFSNHALSNEEIARFADKIETHCRSVDLGKS